LRRVSLLCDYIAMIPLQEVRERRDLSIRERAVNCGRSRQGN
jgi:hypothetical protein